MSKSYLLCFHDLSVWNFKTVASILQEIQDITKTPFSILVIPDTEGASHEQIQEYRKFLYDLQDKGFELALHGFRHHAKLSKDRSYIGLCQMKMTNGEAEFAGICKQKTKKLLKQGLEAWFSLMEQEGQKTPSPVAFIPPTWYGNKSLPSLVNRAGMLYESRIALSPVIGRTKASPVVSFAGIPRASEPLAFLWGELMLKSPVGVPRIALHPEDFPRLKYPIKKLIRSATAQRRIIFYRDI
ncbi:MAG: DUF2334 domain-containing protein [Candidatus Saccharibacteria bacterium]|nr:DUF2334 domain-containing protein [Candidatus Saccharibacteria bacterium]